MSYQTTNVTQVKLAPSLLAADFTRLGEQVTAAEQAGAGPFSRVVSALELARRVGLFGQSGVGDALPVRRPS